MSYVIEILDSSGNKVAQMHENECEARLHREINADWYMKISYPVPQNEYQGEDKSEYLVTWKYQIRMFNTKDSTDYQTFVITRSDRIRKPSGAVVVEVQADHVAISDMNEEVIHDTLFLYNMTPSAALTQILGYSTNWSAGTVGPTTPISIDVSWETVMSALIKLVKACGGEWTADEANSEIDISAELGSDNSVHIRPERNLQSVNNRTFSRSVINKMYGVGGGQPSATIAGARHKVSSYVSGTGVITCESNKIVPEDDSWNTDFHAFFVTGTEAGNSFTITDCASGSVNDTLTINTGESISAGDKFVIRTTGGTPVDYIRAGSSITSYGEIEGTKKDGRFLDVTNLVGTPALDGTYTGGLCENWTMVGSFTDEENTTAAYITYGSKSQRCVDPGDGEGIEQDVTVEDGKHYTLLAWVYIVSGTVEVKWDDGTTVTSLTKSDTGWQRFSIRERVNGTTLTVQILAYGGAAEFYVDAVQITEGILNRSFTENSELTGLWDATYDQLIKVKDPRIEYVANFIDLYRIDSGDYPDDEISIGDTVTITDDSIGITAQTARVKKIFMDVFRPEITQHTVSNVI